MMAGNTLGVDICIHLLDCIVYVLDTIFRLIGCGISRGGASLSRVSELSADSIRSSNS
jgi:hypothetical protein